jgi:hypothetical protein
MERQSTRKRRKLPTYSPMRTEAFGGAAALIGFLVALLLALLCGGCSTLKPTGLVEVSHTSHASQHFGPDQTNYGWNVYSLGVRLRPIKGLTIDLTEGYSPERLDGRHEVFNGRVTYEVRFDGR